uniref:Ig-like domain-containing protein n=1 Tax=Cyprinodon variegatus TaxID=28743 RepID=A0A3Q2CQT7_CYPVA
MKDLTGLNATRVWALDGCPAVDLLLRSGSFLKKALGQKPVFIQPITSFTVSHGEVARFHARVSGTPKPEIRWFHNRQPVQPSKNVVFHFDEVTNVATLIIVDAFSEHAGQYTCRAANKAGEAACSASLTVIRAEEEEESGETEEETFYFHHVLF